MEECLTSSVLLFSALDQTHDDSRRALIENDYDAVLQSRLLPTNLGKDWSTKLTTEAGNVSKTMASVTIQRTLSEKRVVAPPEEELRFTEHLLGPVGSVLLTACYGHRFSRVGKVPDAVPLTAAMESVARQLLIAPDIPDVADADDLYVDVKANRESAAADLREAFSLLQTEVLLATVQKKLSSHDSTTTS